MTSSLRWSLIDCETHHGAPEAFPESIAAANGHFRLHWEKLSGGLREGVHVLTVDTGAVRVAILPERGMGIWKCWRNDTEFGWQSPVRGPVHPHFVPIQDASGIGWLEGFDELVVRCGLESNGAPELDDRGHVRYPLHGRIANRPAYRLTVEVDPMAGVLDVRGWVEETRFLIRSTSLMTHYQFRVNQPGIAITDTVTNLSANATTIQLLYHINVGQPILEAGSRFFAASKKVSPRNAHAAKDIASWTTYKPPTPGYVEQVYFTQPYADAQHWSTAMLTDSRQDQAFAVRYDTKTLPCLTLWKNTAAVEDGYVTGLEPATGFPNTRSFEEKQGRLVALASGESKRFRLQLEPIIDGQRVREVIQEIEAQQQQPAEVLSEPFPQWAS